MCGSSQSHSNFPRASKCWERPERLEDPRMFRVAVSTPHEIITDVDSKESNKASAHPHQETMCARHLLLRGSPWRNHTQCNCRAPEDLNAWSSATFLVVCGSIEVIRSCKLALSKMLMIASTSRRHSVRRKEAPPQLMSVYFCQPRKASNLLAPQLRLALRRSRCRLQVGKSVTPPDFSAEI